MKRSEVLFGLLRLPLDALGVMAALLLSYILREQSIDLVPGIQLLEPAQTLPPKSEYIELFVTPSVGMFILIAAALGLYAMRSTRSAWNEVGRLLIASLLWLVAVVAWYFLIRKQLFYSRILLLHGTFFIAMFVLLGRTCVVLLQRTCLRWGIGVRAIASLGKQKVPRSVQRILEEDVRYQYLGHVSGKKGLEKFEYIDLVLQTDAMPDSEVTTELINYCRAQHIGYAFLPPVFADVPHLLVIERIGLTPLMRFQPTPLDGWGRVWKRLFDVVGSILLLIILLPVLVLIALSILLESGFPIFYISRRIGERGHCCIPMIKFRSMVKNADSLKSELNKNNQRTDGPLFKMQNDPRVTAVGKFLRRWDLDELPQLLNVFAGHMSLVGPRPHLPEEVDKYTESLRRVFAVRPGMTGFAQISGRSDLRFADEVALDLRYVEEWSLFLDLWILWRTFFVVLERQNH